MTILTSSGLNTIMESDLSKPELFAGRIKDIFGGKAGDVLEAISHPRYETFRLNLNKSGVKEVLRKLRGLGFEIREGVLPGSYVNLSSLNGSRISQTEFFKNGIVYVQGLSSMLDVVVLDPKPDEKILDLCASPGSKTSYIASMTGVPGNIYAVENNSARFFSLKKNLALQGFDGVVTVKSNAVGLINRYPEFREFFDKILVDVPCSNEGNVRFVDKDPLKFWNPKLPKKISMLQKKILASGYNMLKPGGFMVYSTCTYSFEENEAVINWVLKKFTDLEAVEVTLPFKELSHVRGITEHRGEKVDSRISGALRILPGNYFDGFFISLLQRQSVQGH